MTVREWFRIQRGALYDRGDSLFGTIDQVATMVVNGQEPAYKLFVGESIIWLRSREELRREELYRQLDAKLRRAAQLDYRIVQ